MSGPENDKTPLVEEEEELDSRTEILGGLAVYAVLTACAFATLLPAVLLGGLPETPVPAGELFYDVRGGEGRFSRYNEKVLVVCFFSLEDSVSREQMAHLGTLRGRFPGDKVGIFAACVSPSDPAGVSSFARKMKAPFPVVMCPEDVSRDILARGSVPVISIRDAGGRTRNVFRRLVPAEEMAARIKAILK